MSTLLDRLAARPLPGRKVEGWRWSDLSAAERLAAVAPRLDAAVPDHAHLWLDVPGERLLFVDGRLVGGAVPASLERLPDHPLAQLSDGAHGARFALGEAQSSHGLLQVVHVATGGAASLAHAYRLERDAVASVVETYVGAADAWTNVAVTAELEEGARLMRAVRVIGAGALHTEVVHADVAATGSYAQGALVAGGDSVRMETHAATHGPGAFVGVDGAALGRGQATVDIVNKVTHAAPGGTSNQTWRTVADDRATVSVQGGVSVARGAQKTDARQSIRALLLKRTATANAKPELEIYADDVKCAHGATVGELDRMALFYLRSRGVPAAEARALLTEAFVGEALALVGQEAVREAFEADARAWLLEGSR